MQRDREQYETPNLPDQADTATWLRQQLARFNAEARAQQSPSPQKQDHHQQQQHEHGGEEPKDASGEVPEEQAAETAPTHVPAAATGSSRSVSNSAGKHGAIFKLVYGLLDGADRR